MNFVALIKTSWCHTSGFTLLLETPVMNIVSLKKLCKRHLSEIVSDVFIGHKLGCVICQLSRKDSQKSFVIQT